MGETWKVIPDFDPYEASDKGRIRRAHGVSYVILKPWTNQYGHEIVDIKIRGKRHVSYVHRLVAFAFINNPENKPCVNHKDNNPHNNVSGNLEWCTKKENSQWMSNQLRGTSVPVIATEIETGKQIRFDRLQDVRNFGFQPSCVCCCCKGKRGFSQHKGYRWRYV